MSTISYQKMKEHSSIYLPVSILRQDVRDYIYTLLPDTLFEGTERDGLPVSIRVKKGSFVEVELDGDVVDIHLPMDMLAAKKMGFLSATAEGGLVVHLRSKVNLDSSWHLRTITSLEDYRWTKEPKINLLGFHLNVGQWASGYIDKNQAQWLTRMDDTLSKMNVLHSQISALQQRITQPIALDSQQQLHLKLFPLAIHLKHFATDESHIKTALQLSFDAVIQRGEGAGEIPDSTLPRFNWVRGDAGDIPLTNAIALTLSKEDLQLLADDWVRSTPVDERSFDLKGKNMTIDRVSILTRDNKIGARVYFSGDRSGSLLYLAKPKWNAHHKEIRLAEEEVDLQMHHLGTKWLYFLFKRKIKKSISSTIQSSINQYLHDAIHDFETQLNNQLPGSSIRIEDYGIDPLQVEQDALFMDIRFTLTGTTTLHGIRVWVE